MSVERTLIVNGVSRTVRAEPDAILLHVLRGELGLLGTRFGCGQGPCGACTVLLDGRAKQSCQLQLVDVGSQPVTTVEGLGTVAEPHPLQLAFADEQAGQCCYCLSGILMTSAELLARDPNPSEDAVRSALDRHLCRCGAHNRIVRAVLRAAASMR